MDDRSDVPAMMRRELDSWLQYGGMEPDRGKVMPRTSAPVPSPVLVAPGTRPSVRTGVVGGPRATPSAGPASRFTPAAPRFTPGQLARSPSQTAAPAEAPRFTPTQPTGLSPVVAIPAAGVAGTGIYQAAQGLRERRDGSADYGSLGEMPSEEIQRMLAARRMQAIDDEDRRTWTPDIEMDIQREKLRRMQAVDDADREADARMIAARARQAIDDRDRMRDVARPQLSEPEGTGGGSVVAPSRDRGSESFLSKIFSGKDYQSAGGPMYVQRGGERYLNWGDPESSADFVRAAQAMSRMSPEQQSSLKGVSGRDVEFENRMAASQGKAEGGSVGGKGPTKEAMLHKALEIIHHLIQK
jgi:hypothetical protein